MDNIKAPSFYHMVPNNTHQYMGILQLLLHFKWTWVGFFAAVGGNLEWFIQTMLPVFSQQGICFAYLESFSNLGYDYANGVLMKWWIGLYDKIIKSKANVLIFNGDNRYMIILRKLVALPELKASKLKGQVWIFTSPIELKSFANEQRWDLQAFHGAVAVAVHSNELLGFRQFLKSRSPSGCNEDGFIRDFWAYAFGCAVPDSVLDNRNGENCTGEERLENLPEHILEKTMTGRSYSIYNAVYVVTHALNAMHSSQSKLKGRMKESRKQLQPWEVKIYQQHFESLPVPVKLKNILFYKQGRKYSYFHFHAAPPLASTMDRELSRQNEARFKSNGILKTNKQTNPKVLQVIRFWESELPFSDTSKKGNSRALISQTENERNITNKSVRIYFNCCLNCIILICLMHLLFESPLMG